MPASSREEEEGFPGSLEERVLTTQGEKPLEKEVTISS
jgi:hypothetical protein